MLCLVCDRITLKSLHSPMGYEHLPSFEALKSAAEAGVCSLCNLLWRAVLSTTADSESQRECMQYPVRLRFNGKMPSFASKELEKRARRPNNDNDAAIYDIVSSKRPSAINIYSLRPDTFRKNESGLSIESRVLIYKQPSKHVSVLRCQSMLEIL